MDTTTYSSDSPTNTYHMMCPENDESEYFFLNTFLFTDPSGDDDTHCFTTICIKDVKQSINQAPLWDIKLSSVYSTGQKVLSYVDVVEYNSHPMLSRNSNSYISNFKGFQIIKNDMTRMMIHYLMMEDQELANKTDTMTPQEYRRKTLQCLSQFTV